MLNKTVFKLHFNMISVVSPSFKGVAMLLSCVARGRGSKPGSATITILETGDLFPNRNMTKITLR